jgi:hypothetical protein
LDEHIDILFNEKTTSGLPDTSEWTSYPTTRQGDECERKLAVLEEELEALRFNAESDEVEEEEDEDSLSDSEVDYCSGRPWARITPSQDEFDYAISVSSEISKLTLELPDDFDETFEHNLGQLHMPTPSPSGSCASIIKPYCEYDFESDDDMDISESISTHSSMPSLIPIVESDEDSDSKKRRRTSQEICGNE